VVVQRSKFLSSPLFFRSSIRGQHYAVPADRPFSRDNTEVRQILVVSHLRVSTLPVLSHTTVRRLRRKSDTSPLVEPMSTTVCSKKTKFLPYLPLFRSPPSPSLFTFFVERAPPLPLFSEREVFFFNLFSFQVCPSLGHLMYVKESAVFV